MKSVTIKQRGVLLIKIIHRKNGKIEITKHKGLADIDIDVRDDTGHKIYFDDRGKTANRGE